MDFPFRTGPWSDNMFWSGSFVCLFFVVFLAMPCGLQNLSSPTRGEPRPLAMKVESPNHRFTRAFAGQPFLKIKVFTN